MLCNPLIDTECSIWFTVLHHAYIVVGMYTCLLTMLNNTKFPKYKQTAETHSTSQHIKYTYMYVLTRSPCSYTLHCWGMDCWSIGYQLWFYKFYPSNYNSNKCQLTSWESYWLDQKNSHEHWPILIYHTPVRKVFTCYILEIAIGHLKTWKFPRFQFSHISSA